MAAHAEFFLALIGFLGIAAQWLAWRLGLPAILFLLLTGLLAGPVTGWIRPDDLLGDMLFPLVSLGVAVILFEGSLTLRIHEIRGHGKVVRHLVTIGLFITWLGVGGITWWLLDSGWEVAFLFGAVVTVTGPTVIVPMLRTVRPTAVVANILRWEGILIDPLGALLAVLVFEFVVSGQQEDRAALLFSKALLVGGSIGAAAAYGLATLLRRYLLPDYLHNVATLALVLMVFASADILQQESGLLAVTVMGMMLANMKNVPIEGILDFKESLSILVISLLFIILAARIEFSQFQALGLDSLALLAAMILFIRPLAVWISSLGTALNWREKALIAWIGPRGIVAAAMSALFALKLGQAGYPEAELLVPLTFLVIVGTVILQSVTARPIAGWLQVTAPEPRGVLIAGGNRVALAIAQALSAQGIRVLLADSHWEYIRAARMAGLDTYFGNIVSQHADRHLDLTGLGRLFAMSQRPDLNALACVHYRSEFGADAVFVLPAPEEETAAPKKRTVTRRYNGRRLFGSDITYSRLESLLDKGAEIRATPLTANFDLAAFQRHYAKGAIPLFALDDKDRLHVYNTENAVDPRPGWRIVSLLPLTTLGESSKTQPTVSVPA